MLNWLLGLSGALGGVAVSLALSNHPFLTALTTIIALVVEVAVVARFWRSAQKFEQRVALAIALATLVLPVILLMRSNDPKAIGTARLVLTQGRMTHRGDGAINLSVNVFNSGDHPAQQGAFAFLVRSEPRPLTPEQADVSFRRMTEMLLPENKWTDIELDKDEFDTYLQPSSHVNAASIAAAMNGLNFIYVFAIVRYRNAAPTTDAQPRYSEVCSLYSRVQDAFVSCGIHEFTGLTRAQFALSNTTRKS